MAKKSTIRLIEDAICEGLTPVFSKFGFVQKKRLFFSRKTSECDQYISLQVCYWGSSKYYDVTFWMKSDPFAIQTFRMKFPNPSPILERMHWGVALPYKFDNSFILYGPDDVAAVLPRIAEIVEKYLIVFLYPLGDLKGIQLRLERENSRYPRLLDKFEYLFQIYAYKCDAKSFNDAYERLKLVRMIDEPSPERQASLEYARLLAHATPELRVHLEDN